MTERMHKLDSYLTSEITKLKQRKFKMRGRIKGYAKGYTDGRLDSLLLVANKIGIDPDKIAEEFN